MKANAKDYNKYIVEMGVYYLYLILMVLKRVALHAYNIKIENDEVISFSELIKKDYKIAIRFLKLNPSSQNYHIENSSLENEYQFVERFIYVAKEVVDGKNSYESLEKLVKCDTSRIISLHFGLNYSIECNEVIAEIKKMISNIRKYKETGIDITVLLHKNTVEKVQDNNGRLIELTGDTYIEDLTDFSKVMIIYQREKNKLNNQICCANEELSRNIAKIIRPIFKENERIASNNKGSGIVSIANLFIDYYVTIISMEIIQKRVELISNIKNVYDLKHVVTNQDDFISSKEIKELMG